MKKYVWTFNRLGGEGDIGIHGIRNILSYLSGFCPEISKRNVSIWPINGSCRAIFYQISFTRSIWGSIHGLINGPSLSKENVQMFRGARKIQVYWKYIHLANCEKVKKMHYTSWGWAVPSLSMLKLPTSWGCLLGTQPAVAGAQD